MCFFLVVFFCRATVSAQNQQVVDSLLQVLETIPSEKEKVDIYVKLAEKYSDYDSSNTVKYANQAMELAEKIDYSKGRIEALHEIAWVTLQREDYTMAERLFKQEIQEAEATDNLQSKAYGLNGLGLISEYQDDYQKALEYLFQALEIRKGLGNKRAIGISYGNIGFIYNLKGDYEKALEYYFQSLRIYEELGNKLEMSYSFNNIGLIYSDQGNYEKALGYYFQSLETFKELEDMQGISYSYDNIGFIYDAQGDYEKALKYYLKSLEILQELEFKSGLGSSYNSIGSIYQIQGDYEKALEHYLKSLEIHQELGSKIGMGASYYSLGAIYLEQDKLEKAFDYFSKALELYEIIGAKANQSFPLIGIGQIYKQGRKWNLAQQHLAKALTLAQETGIVASIRDAAELLALVEKELGNYKAAYEAQALFKQMADSLQNEEQTKNLTRMEAEYEFKQEKDSIELANKSQQIAFEKDIENRKITQRATFIGLGLSGLLLFVLFLFFQSKRKDNRLLTERSQQLKTAHEEVQIINEELQTANEEIQSTNEVLNTTLDTVKHQRDEILSSIQYAQRIQASILPSPEYLQSLLKEHLVLFKPRDVVSGDFYWCAQLEDKLVLTAIDCTGHGVPGAFMSMVGNALLNNIVKERRVFQADVILGELHKGIRETFQQKETQNRDGMDLALVVVNITDKSLEFAGAKNPLVYIQHNSLHCIKGDKMPIGGEQREKDRVFTKHTLSFVKNPITFYLFSDGFQDQFGGPKRKKFMSKKLRNLLYENHDKPMEEQRELLNNTFEEWKGSEKQIDDVVIVGVQLS